MKWTQKRINELSRISKVDASELTSGERMELAEKFGLVQNGLWVHEEKPKQEEQQQEEQQQEEQQQEEQQQEEQQQEEQKEEQQEEQKEEQQEEEKPPVVSSGDDFDVLIGRIKAAPAPEAKVPSPSKGLVTKERKRKSKKESSPESFRLEGYILLLMIDTVFPFALSFVNNMIDKRIKVSPSDLELEDKDFAKLEPLADQAADYLAFNVNPVAGFLIVSGIMYSNNLITARGKANIEINYSQGKISRD